MILGTGDAGSFLQRPFTEIAILMNYAGSTKKSFEIVIVTLHPFGCRSTIITYASHPFGCLPLCCLTSLSSHCSVFKVQLSSSFEARSQDPIPLGLEIQQQLLSSLVGPSGLEPPTLRLSVVRSSQLSHRPVVGANSTSLASPSGQSSRRSVAPPLQTKPASLGFRLVLATSALRSIHPLN